MDIANLVASAAKSSETKKSKNKAPSIVADDKGVVMAIAAFREAKKAHTEAEV